jgi:hyperosmotically inducible periplasmic protein
MKSSLLSVVVWSAVVPGLAFFSLTGCSSAAKSPDVAGNIRKSLDQPAFKDVSVTQDRDKGVVTLKGHVATDSEKAEAESIAKSGALGQVVSDEIAVLPPGNERAAKAADSDLDQAIQKNLDALKAEKQLEKNVKYSVKNGVVTLTGSVNSQPARVEAQQVAANVPSVQQVVNELQILHQKATTDKP